MNRTFKEALQHRRTYYAISNRSLISDKEIQDIITTAVACVPSPFNSQSTRIVLLLGDHHRKLWQIVKDTLQKNTSADQFQQTQAKIDGSFASGYGTVLFFEDQAVVKGLQTNFPLYSDVFPVWSQHTDAMHQLAIWVMLEDAGFGASLQHYNPLIDEAVQKEWKLDTNWKLVAQMPFGVPVAEPGNKDIAPLEKRVLVFS